MGRHRDSRRISDCIGATAFLAFILGAATGIIAMTWFS